MRGWGNGVWQRWRGPLVDQTCMARVRGAGWTAIGESGSATCTGDQIAVCVKALTVNVGLRAPVTVALALIARALAKEWQAVRLFVRAVRECVFVHETEAAWRSSEREPRQEQHSLRGGISL